jgi:hypothetical protein
MGEDLGDNRRFFDGSDLDPGNLPKAGFDLFSPDAFAIIATSEFRYLKGESDEKPTAPR